MTCLLRCGPTGRVKVSIATRARPHGTTCSRRHPQPMRAGTKVGRCRHVPILATTSTCRPTDRHAHAYTHAHTRVRQSARKNTCTHSQCHARAQCACTLIKSNTHACTQTRAHALEHAHVRHNLDEAGPHDRARVDAVARKGVRPRTYPLCVASACALSHACTYARTNARTNARTHAWTRTRKRTHKQTEAEKDEKRGWRKGGGGEDRRKRERERHKQGARGPTESETDTDTHATPTQTYARLYICLLSRSFARMSTFFSHCTLAIMNTAMLSRSRLRTLNTVES
eukprot:6190489-Pleurochrysis_carterae.AAC.3